VEKGDLVFVTNGSMTADKSFGSMTKAGDGARKAKRCMAAVGDDWRASGIRQPAAFDSHIDESPGVVHGDVERSNLLQLMQQFSGSEPARRPDNFQGL